MAIPGLPLGNVPDSNVLPDPAGEMYEFYEGLDTNLFSESTGMNHNSAPKWIRNELARHLEFLSYLLSVKDNQAIMSDDIVHTESILDDNVTISKLHPDLRNLLDSIRPENVVERNSVQTFNALSLAAGKIRVKNGTIISQAEGFSYVGQNDVVEVLTETDIAPTVGETSIAYLYKTVGGAYFQSKTKQNILNIETMVGTRVLLGTFSVDSTNQAFNVVSAVPTLKTRNIEEPTFSGQYVLMPSGTTSERPALTSNQRAIRFNNTLSTWESWNGTFWGDLGTGQLLGSTQKKAVMFMGQSIIGDLTIPDGCNGFSIGRVTIEAGSKLTVPEGSVYKIL